MTRYSKRIKPPSQYRCLKHLYWPGVALFITLAYTNAMRVISELAGLITGKPLGSAGDMPMPMFWTLVAMTAYGLVACSYRAYRDLYKGDYWMDHPSF